MVQAGANYLMVEKAQQLFAYLVGDETVLNKTEVCNFCFKVDANKTGATCVARSEHSCSARACERCKLFAVM